MDKDLSILWDVAVIGGGPAGMMAAGRAAERGLKVILIEKNDSLGKKLLITGGGRCNVTNGELDTRTLLSKFKDNDKFLFSAFSQWSVQETLDFFHIHNMETKEEKEKRVFPISNKSQSVWNVLVENLKKHNVTILSNSPVIEIIRDSEKNTISGIKLKNNKTITAHSYIVATGGKSRPETGSTGDGFVWLKKLGHDVIEPEASLVPIEVEDAWVKRLQGISMPEVKITLFQNEIKQDVQKGKILFTHFGISGPTVLNMSKDISELLKYGEVIISVDALPVYDPGTLNLKLQELLRGKDINKKLKNVLDEIIPAALVVPVLELSAVNGDTASNSVTREERLQLVKTLKDMRMRATGLLGLDKAIITSGGVSLDEVDFKTMRSRLFSNLYLIGDVLNIDRPSGGYSLQLCWTTGFVAGNSISSSQ
ncbi:MAG: aminoacetone oxidase family FAD-binding enzyme [Patescibacteria group bacterium]